ncbi:MAG: mucoidy inhibitor MuiA family protein [Chromatocurvus sp.]
MRFVSILAALLMLGSPAQARIDAVVVFPDRATVTRVVTQRVEAGSGALELVDLPIGLDRDSLRVTAAGEPGMQLGAVELSPIRAGEQVSPRARELEERIQALQDRIRVLDDGVRARDLQLQALSTLTSSPGDPAHAPADYLGVLTQIGDRADDVLTAKRQLEFARRDVADELAIAEQRLNDLGAGRQDRLRLAARYMASESGTTEFRIVYTVPGARWRPVYQWRLDTTGSSLTLIQSAEVTQSTGEDWKDARLRLSLVRPAAGGRLPELRPWWIDVVRPRPEAKMSYAAEGAALRSRSDDELAASPMNEAEPMQAELAGTEWTRHYSIPGRVSVAADNQPVQLQIDEYALDATLSARAVPRRQPMAWSFVEAVYIGEAALPPGAVTLYQDNTLVGERRFAGVVPGAPLESSFGVDNAIEIEYERVRDDRARKGLISKSSREVREYLITLTNGHSRPIVLTVLDQMPVSRDDRIEVELTDNTTTPRQSQGAADSAQGMLRWMLDLKPGETREVRVGYVVTFPEDLPGVSGW